ncbi:serine--tRNA ligase [Candidatus Kuenenbacteria bacterium HGW-Kuenenbacteria-1]|uniref:Serine--tRNA ligase n=1 Tax=Candidatus Kuenenbacteria bacterium HGW-Kuenenbacteria-1 TaxID=2013812 RepID=A0A2N1UNH5_9BACT|nr:MAG: serine--tRNA ligase [Candidatus Kuenenbacteria bacterium HGW-Kuenenbacteria-1]
MLDIKFIRENKKEIELAAKNKNIKIDLDELLKLDNDKKSLISQINDLRTKRNELANQSKNSKPSDKQIAYGKKLKEQIAELENGLVEIDKNYLEIAVKVPNIPSFDTPIGKNEEENVEVYKWGEPTKFDFKPKSYIELAEELDLIDFKRGTKTGGYRSYYLKNEAVMLVMGFMMHALSKLIKNGFTPVIPPTLVKNFALFGSGYFAGDKYNQEVDEIYKIANDDKLADGSIKKEDKFLIGTAEPSLLAYYADEILNEKDLPIKFAGFSQCYRSEIGSYGKDTKGIYRVHEFMKVEQVVICRADKDESEKLHQEIISLSKELHEDLGLPYRQIQICTGDMSAGKYKMFDLEAWIPSRNSYGETGSASNFLDWQSRRLNVKYKDKNGDKKYVYMLNNTALASPRTLIAILENYQQADGSIKIPEVLWPYMGGIKVIKQK